MQENETGWPVSFENRPGAHSVQSEADVCASAAEYLPTGHGLQTSAEVCEAPASEKRPLPHALHVCVELSAASLYSPARHGVQTPEPTTHPIPGLGQQATNAMEPPRLTDANMLLWSAVLSTHAGAQRGSWSYAYAYANTDDGSVEIDESRGREKMRDDDEREGIDRVLEQQ